MKTITQASVILVICLFLFGCNSAEVEQKAAAEKQQAIQRQELEKHDRMDRAKQEALQNFENFRRAGTLTTGIQSLLAMDQTLARAGMNPADIQINQNEITAHIRDLARRPVPKPKVVARRGPTQHRGR